MGALLLTLQLMLIALLLWPWQPPQITLWALLPVLAGVALGVWTLMYNRPGNFNLRPAVKPGAQLITRGPYRWVRHPMYSTLFLFGIAAVMVYPLAGKLACFFLLMLVLLVKSQVEERALRESFSDYPAYASRTGKFIPRMRHRG